MFYLLSGSSKLLSSTFPLFDKSKAATEFLELELPIQCMKCTGLSFCINRLSCGIIFLLLDCNPFTFIQKEWVCSLLFLNKKFAMCKTFYFILWCDGSIFSQWCPCCCYPYLETKWIQYLLILFSFLHWWGCHFCCDWMYWQSSSWMASPCSI